MAYNAPGGERRIAIEKPLWSIEEVMTANRLLIETPHALKYLETKRGIKEEMIQRFTLGFISRLQAITVPIYDANGSLFNIRFHSIRSKKKWGIQGRTTLMLYDYRFVNWDADEIFIVEGEPDLWSANRIGLNAITTTGGAGTMHTLIHEHIDKFAGKKIYLLTDNDEAGNEAAARVRCLFDSSAKVFKVTWPISAPNGYDLTDWVVQDGAKFGDVKDALMTLFKPYDLSEATSLINLSDECFSELENNSVYVKNNEYWKKAQKGMARRVSTFILRPRMRLVNPLSNDNPNEILVADIVCGQNIYTGRFIPKDAFSSRKSFLKILPSPEMSFRGNETDLQDMMEFVAGTKRKIKKKHAVDYFGIIPEHDAWVSPNCVIDRTGFVQDSNVIAIPQGTVVEDRISPVDAGPSEKQHILSKMLELIPQVHTPECAMVTWAWMTSCYLKPWFSAYKLGGFPILNIYGTAGGGKTSIASLFYRTFGYTETEPFSARMTQFSVLKLLSVTTTIPLIIDEFKYDLPPEVITFWRNRSRSIYTGETDFRGTQEQKLIQYKCRAPLVICGEVALPSEKALLERVVPASPSPFWLQSEQGKKAREVFEELKNVNLEAFPGYFVPWLLTNRKELIAKGINDAIYYVRKKSGKTRLPIRIEKNLAVLRLGIYTIRKFMEENLDKPDFTTFDELSDKALTWTINEMKTIEAYGRTKMAIDELIESLSIMAMSNKIQKGINYCLGSTSEGVIKVEGERGDFPRFLYIHFGSCFAEFCKWARETQYRGEVLDKNAYYRQMRECCDNKEYIIDTGRNKRFDSDAYGTTIKRTLLIDLLKACEMGLDVDGFGVPSGKLSASLYNGGNNEEIDDEKVTLPQEYSFGMEDEAYSNQQGIGGGEDDIPF